MKQFFTSFLILILLNVSFPYAVVLAQGYDPSIEPDSGAVVCPPGVYLAPPADCSPLGPSAYLTGLASLGLTFPPRPLPAHSPNPELVSIPYRYFMVESTGTYLYPSLADASSQQASSVFMKGFVYVAYTDRVDTGHGIYYMTPDGWWLPGKGSRVSAYSDFQGLLFDKTPCNSFGWIIEEVPTKSAPGYNAPDTGQRLYRFNIVQVYSTEIVADMEWDLIGPDEWVEGRKVARVILSTIPPEGVTTGRWIEVNLEEQTLTVYSQSELVFATMIATGLEPFWTKPGLFQIYEKKPIENMSGSFEADKSDYYYLQNVPWTMYYDQARALHGAYWHTNFGYQQSHGCINMSVGDARWLFDWSQVGDWVYVHDPSGRTPTDPSLYTTGAP